MDTPGHNMMKSSILVRYDCYNDIKPKTTPLTFNQWRNRVPVGEESPGSKVKAWLTKYTPNLSCQNPVEYPEETLLRVEESFARENNLEQKDYKDDSYDMLPMSPESQKKIELCSYLKLMNMKVKKNKNGMVLQNRRSTRVKNLMILTEKKELERKLSVEAKESEKSVKFKLEEEFNLCFNGGFSVKHVPEDLIKKEEDFEASMKIVVRDVRKIRNKENLKMKNKQILNIKFKKKENYRLRNRENKNYLKNKKNSKIKVKNKTTKRTRIWGTRTSPRAPRRILREKVREKFKSSLIEKKVKLNAKKKKCTVDKKKRLPIKKEQEGKKEPPEAPLQTITLIEHNYTLDPSYKALNQEISNNSPDKEIIKKLTPEHRKALLESSKIASKIKITDSTKSTKFNGKISSKEYFEASSQKSLRSSSLPENKQENGVNNNIESDFKIVLLNGARKDKVAEKEDKEFHVKTQVEDKTNIVKLNCDDEAIRRIENFDVKVIIGVMDAIPKTVLPVINCMEVIKEPTKINCYENMVTIEQPNQTSLLNKTHQISRNKEAMGELKQIPSPRKTSPIRNSVEIMEELKVMNSPTKTNPNLKTPEIKDSPKSVSSPNSVKIIPVSKLSQKSLHKNLSSKHKHLIKSPPMTSLEINTWDNRKSPHAINLSNEHGAILNASYFDYNLIITQDLRVSFWTQSALGFILEAQNMWIPKGGLQRLALDNGCVLRVCQESVFSKEGSFGYIELYTKEHKSDRRERPVADVFSVIYFWREKQREPEKKLLQLENINGSAEDVRHVVLKNSGNILVSWKVFKDDQVVSAIHSYQLADDYQTIVGIKELESVDHTINTLHNIEDCDGLVMGCGDHKITIWNLEFGYIVAAIDISDSLNIDSTTLWVKCDRGFLFTLQQCSDGSLRLLAINGINHSWKKLQIYKAPTGFYKLEGVCIENGILICFYANGVLCYKVQSGDLVMEELSSETKYLPSGKHVITYTSDSKEVNVRNSLSYLITNYDFTDT